MTDFIAKNNYYGEPLHEDDSNNHLPEHISKVKSSSELDFSSITLNKLAKDLEIAISKRTPIFLWSKKRNIEKIELDNKYLVLLRDKINFLRGISQDFGEFKAETIFSEQHISNMVADKYMRAKQYFEKAELTHFIDMLSLKSQGEAIRFNVKELEIRLKKQEADLSKLQADARYRHAEADSIESQNELRRIVRDKIDFNKFPPAYLSDLLSALAGINMKSVGDYDLEEKLKNIYERMENAKANKAEAEVNDFMNSSEFRKWKNDQAKKDAGL